MHAPSIQHPPHDASHDHSLDDLPQRAERAAADPALLRAFDAAVRDGVFRTLALTQPDALLERFGVRLPHGLSVQFFEGDVESRAYPFGDGYFPTIKLTSCRTHWVRECTTSITGTRPLCGVRKEEVCFGFEIVPGKWLPRAH